MNLLGTVSMTAILFLVVGFIQRTSANANDLKVAVLGAEINKLRQKLHVSKATLEATKRNLRSRVVSRTGQLIAKAQRHAKQLNIVIESKFKHVNGTLQAYVNGLLRNIENYARRIKSTYDIFVPWLEKQSATWMGENEAAWKAKHQWSIDHVKKIQISLRKALLDLKKVTVPLQEKFEKAATKELTDEEKTGKPIEDIMFDHNIKNLSKLLFKSTLFQFQLSLDPNPVSVSNLSVLQYQLKYNKFF